MATTSQRLAALEAWKTAHLQNHVLSGHTHSAPPHDHALTYAAKAHTHTTTPPPVEPPPPPPPPPPSASTMPTTDLPGWRLIFNDDFLTPVPLGQFPTAVASKWAAYPYPWSTLKGFYDPGRVVSIHDGTLDMWLRNVSGEWLFAAPVPKINPTADTSGNPVNGQDQLYGRYAARFHVTATPGAIGYYAAWLLWPKSDTWPRDGEIDFPEGDLISTIGGFMHHMNATAGNDQDGFTTGVPFAGWHTVVTEWSPNLVRFYLDGVLIGTTTTRIPNTPMHWVLQTTTSTAGLPTAGTDTHLLVDWVAIWAYAP